jgi:hypothetical protein
MPSELPAAEGPEQKNASKYGVDLLNLQERSTQGEDINVREEYINTVTPADVAAKIDELKVSSGHLQTRRKVKRLLGNTRFAEVFDQAIAQSPDFETLQWRLGAYINKKNFSQDIYRHDTPRREVTLTQDRIIYSALMQILDFGNANPELMDDAFEAWFALGVRFDQRGERSVIERVNRIHELRQRSDQLTDEEKKRETDLVAEVVKKITWKSGVIDSYKDDPRIWSLISNLELIPLDQVDEQTLDAIQQSLLEGVEINKKPGEIIATSINITKNVVGSLAEMMEDPKSKAATVANAISNIEKQEDGPVTPSGLIRLANVVSALIQRDQNLDIPKLNVQTIDDLPKAIDRALFFAFDEEAIAYMDTYGVAEKYQAAAECAKLLALKGVEDKLGQNVLTVGDLIMRYSGRLSNGNLNALIKESEKGQRADNVERVYRKLRLRMKHSSRFRREGRGNRLD